MDAATLQTLMTAAVRTATEQTKREFQETINRLTDRLATLETTPTTVIEYAPVTITGNVLCDESLDLVKSLPEFNGTQSRYVSWRNAAQAAYKLYEVYDGSSRHYQAVAIIRNKVTGAADNVLASFNTVLNFRAIIARLDFTYSDKRPVHMIEQEMSTLRQGGKNILQFYDEVERKLTLLVNKTVMTYNGNAELISTLNQKYRQDALRVFISVLNRPLCDILFSSRPADMPTALALAQELEANQARSSFAQSFFNRNERLSGAFQRTAQHNTQSYPQYRKIETGRQDVVPMEVDPTLSHHRQNNPPPRQPIQSRNATGSLPQRNPFNSHRTQGALNDREAAQERRIEGDRRTLPKQQRINHLGAPEYVDEKQRYDEDFHDSQNVDDSDKLQLLRPTTNDEINFLEEMPNFIFYKPGKDNVVADALSRQHINGLDDSGSSMNATVHSEESLTQTIPTIPNPINCFKSQIILEEGNSPSRTSKVIFRTQMRHHIVYNNRNELLKTIGDCISPSAVNGLLCDREVLAQIQNEVLTRFPSVKFRHTTKQVIDVTNENDQREILETEHNRAHRSVKENLQQILKEYYFPKIRLKLKELILNCKIFREAKYQRHPPNPTVGKTPAPHYPGEILYLDIYSTDKKHFLTCNDKFSKFAIVSPIASRSIVDIKEPII